jgi:CRP-like cAMP-binding protein
MELNIVNLFKSAENTKEFSAGETIFSEGETGDVMYVVMDGDVEIRVRDRVLDVAGPGSTVGEMALIDTATRSATAIAKSDCRLAPVDERQFTYMTAQTPNFALFVMKMLARRLRLMDAMD